MKKRTSQVQPSPNLQDAEFAARENMEKHIHILYIHVRHFRLKVLYWPHTLGILSNQKTAEIMSIGEWNTMRQHKSCIIYSHNLLSFQRCPKSRECWTDSPVSIHHTDHDSIFTPNLSIQRWTCRAAEEILALENAETRAGTAKHLTYWPPGLCVLQGTHGAGPQRVHFITNIDWIMSSQTDWPCPITLVRLWMKHIHLMSGLVGREGWRTHTHSESGPPGAWYTGLTGEQRGIKRTEGGERKKEECLLNDIPIVRRSRTMALCKTANNEHRRNPLSYRGPAACSPLP